MFPHQRRICLRVVRMTLWTFTRSRFSCDKMCSCHVPITGQGFRTRRSDFGEADVSCMALLNGSRRTGIECIRRMHRKRARSEPVFH